MIYQEALREEIKPGNMNLKPCLTLWLTDLKNSKTELPESSDG